ncbi:MAG: ABC transporter permease, partial [Bacteroidales bacterium]|nr:ABC transporter permease [Bacteroidales bacterium]
NYAKSLKVFAIIAIFISCMGIFGLAEFSTKKRIKEIGIRKVNGAKIREVLFLVNKEFIVWIIIASIIAIPITYHIMLSWIQTFAYRTVMSWWIFLLGGLSMLAVSLLSISAQTLQAARRNPVEALRYE